MGTVSSWWCRGGKSWGQQTHGQDKCIIIDLIKRPSMNSALHNLFHRHLQPQKHRTVNLPWARGALEQTPVPVDSWHHGVWLRLLKCALRGTTPLWVQIVHFRSYQSSLLPICMIRHLLEKISDPWMCLIRYLHTSGREWQISSWHLPMRSCPNVYSLKRCSPSSTEWMGLDDLLMKDNSLFAISKIVVALDSATVQVAGNSVFVGCQWSWRWPFGQWC